MGLRRWGREARSFRRDGVAAGIVCGAEFAAGKFSGDGEDEFVVGRLDQNWNGHHHSFLRVGVSPSLETGIDRRPRTRCSAKCGVADGRKSVARCVEISHDTIFNDTTFNQFRFQFARRGLHFGFSELPGGSHIGVNIPGYAYFGREPYWTVDRIERRFQGTDNVTIVHRAHSLNWAWM